VTLNDIKNRIAKAMGWERKDVDSFSLPALRDFVRGKDPDLDRALKTVIDNGLHLYVKPDSEERP